ncbi:phosphoribosyltransferase [Synechococcus sp. PCC 7335]|uniref:phosphoribosyltransferase n=1 Tax=Synechococcus sp. (strain ATCC 29403 / PCC 7335) TaxID=91464 RepID=UPI000315651C|nr:phosphoribosyltransferase [Synechococcus sp. PCC 7335]
MIPRFSNRETAGQQLAKQLSAYANRSNLLVLGLPRGGVPVAYEVAHALNLPLDICLVRKLGLPGHKEVAMGAIAPGGVQIFDRGLIQALAVSDEMIGHVVALERRELQRREQTYRRHQSAAQILGREVILVDDGLATGFTMRAAITAVKAQQARRIVVAVPVAPSSTCRDLQVEVDQLVCLHTPSPFSSIGLWYENFAQTTDEQVIDLLAAAKAHSEVENARSVKSV